MGVARCTNNIKLFELIETDTERIWITSSTDVAKSFVKIGGIIPLSSVTSSTSLILTEKVE